MAGGSDIASPRFTGVYYVAGALFQDGMPVVMLGGAQAGERGIGSKNGADHVAVSGEWKCETVTVAATVDKTVYAGQFIVRMVRTRRYTDAGGALSPTAGIVLVKDGTVVREGAAASLAGNVTIWDGLDGTIFSTSLVLNFASASDTGKIEVFYRPLDNKVSWQVP